ncbi:hypothetical protein [Nonomuraea sp. NPDC005692]|uniref:hypothetical protein n=1 Tax=Nonomuraea sp. NPDC005692 TaxID=3157168 RepID=UPI0033DEEF61
MSDVDMMTAVVLEQLGANRDQLRSLEPARWSPHLLDDHTVGRIKQVFGELRDDMMAWPWLTGLVVGMVAPGQWDIVVPDDRLVGAGRRWVPGVPGLPSDGRGEPPAIARRSVL